MCSEDLGIEIHIKLNFDALSVFLFFVPFLKKIVLFRQDTLVCKLSGAYDLHF